jgi:phage terminase small subunit
MPKQSRRSDEITRLQRTFLLEKLVGLNDKDAALAAGYSLSVAENTKQKIWAKPGIKEEFDRLKAAVRTVGFDSVLFDK